MFTPRQQEASRCATVCAEGRFRTACPNGWQFHRPQAVRALRSAPGKQWHTDSQAACSQPPSRAASRCATVCAEWRFRTACPNRWQFHRPQAVRALRSAPGKQWHTDSQEITRASDGRPCPIPRHGNSLGPVSRPRRATPHQRAISTSDQPPSDNPLPPNELQPPVPTQLFRPRRIRCAPASEIESPQHGRLVAWTARVVTLDSRLSPGYLGKCPSRVALECGVL